MMKRPKSGASGIADILKGLGDLVDRLSEIEEEVAQRGEAGQVGEASQGGQTGEFRSSDGRLRGIFGVNVKVGLGGKEIRMEPFGHTNSAGSARGSASEPGTSAEVHEVREPLCDVFEETNEIVIVAEMPGVAGSDVKLECEGDLLTLRAAKSGRRYAKEIQLPAEVDLGRAQVIENNGVMEIRCPKAAR
jgi:HSP20 family protein